MIPPSAIRKFLNRELDDHSWMKRLSEDKIDQAINRLTPKPNLEGDKFHQKVGFLLGLSLQEFFYIYDMGCVDCDTEYLSPTGWRKMSQYDGSAVAQYWPDTGIAEFVQPSDYVVRPCDEMYRFSTGRGGVDQKLSAEHRVLYSDYRGRPQVASAFEVAHDQDRLVLGWAGRFFTSFQISTDTSIPLSEAELRLMVAVIADGTFPNQNNHCYVRIQKERKQVRLRRLLAEAGVQYSEQPAQPDGFLRFGFFAPRRDKEFTKFYWRASLNQLKVVASEARLWDGSVFDNKPSVQFFSRSRASADFVQYAFCATGKTARLVTADRGDGIDYTVTSREKAALLWLRGITEEKTKTNPVTLEPTVDGKKYCFVVPSSFLVFRRNGCVFLSGNTGKTRLSLRLLEYQYQTGLLNKWSVILVPTDEAVVGWDEEIEKQFPQFPRRLLLGSSEDKWRLLEGFERGLVIVTYVGYAAMVSDLVRKAKAGKGKKERVPHPDLLRYFADRTDGLVMDEITNVANHNSLSYEAAQALSDAAKVRYGLAGRPFGRDPTKVWPQMQLIDHGASLGDTLGMFREAFFTKKRLFWGGPHSYEYKLDKQNEPDLARAIAHRSLRYSIDECVDMSDRTQLTSYSSFSEEQRGYYERVTEALIAARGNFREVENAFIRMRQIASGFLGFVDDDTGERAQLEFKRNPKLDDLMFRMESMPEGRKAIIWHEYTWTGARICKALAKAGMKHGWLWGGTKDWAALKSRFDNDPDFKALVINHKKGAFALNLQAANYDFIFESPVSPIDREQLERRTWRQGQTRPVFQYDLMVKASVDVRIRSFHREGADIFKALVANPQKTLVV